MKADHQGSKFTFTEFRWLGPYIIEKLLLNNKYLVRKIGTNKTHKLHPMKMRQFTPRQPPGDIRITPQDSKPDPDVSLIHDDLLARAGECDYEQPIFEAEKNNATPPNSPEFPVQTEISTEQMRNTPGATHECSPEFFPQLNYINITTYYQLKRGGTVSNCK